MIDAALRSIAAGRQRDPNLLTEHMDGELEPVMFKHTCRIGLAGIVSKRRDKAYQEGRGKLWLKIKNPASAAARRAFEKGWWQTRG